MAINKSNRYMARTAMQKYAYDPIDEQIRIAQENTTTPEMRLSIAQALMPYMYPKLANMEVQSEVDHNVNSGGQAELLRRVLSDPILADAAQKLSLAASDSFLEDDQTIQ